MRRTLLPAGIVCGLALVVSARYVALSSPQPVPTPAAVGATDLDGLRVDPVHLDVGEVWDDQPPAFPLPIRNTTAQPVRISGFASRCDCGTVAPASLTVPPAGTATVTVTGDLGPATTADTRTQPGRSDSRSRRKTGPAG